MSRVGKKPIPLPSGVKINIGDQLQVEGPKGKLTVSVKDGQGNVSRIERTFSVGKQ